MAFSRSCLKVWGKKRGWKCEKCGRRWKDGWKLEFHHIIPSSLGGCDGEDNARLLCLGCHYNAHKAIEIGARISARLIGARLERTGGRWK